MAAAANGTSVSLYGCGVVSPFGQSLPKFLSAMWEKQSALKPSEDFHGTSLVGRPDFNFGDYRDWIVEHVNEKRFAQLQKSAGEAVQYGLGATIEALRQCEGLYDFIRGRRDRVATLIGTGLGDTRSVMSAHDQLKKAQFFWDRFWGLELAEAALAKGDLPDGFLDPREVTNEWVAFEASAALYAHFAQQSPQLKEFLALHEEIERRALLQDGTSLINQLKAKATDRLTLRRRFRCPVPPWESVSPNVLWNIPNLASAQVSMLLESHGLTAGVSGACSTFALSMRLGLDEIHSGNADVAIVGATDCDPPSEIVAAFHAARVAAFGGSVVHPLTELRGTHLSGGSCVWILCRDDVAQKAGLKSLGVTPRGVAVTSDGEHVITPSVEGPQHCIQKALDTAGVQANAVHSWDLHCTGTPGDTQELDHVKAFVGPDALLSARKGLFGHGMAACGGWELTAQMLAPSLQGTSVQIPASGMAKRDVSQAVLDRKMNLLFDEAGSIDLSADRRFLGAKLNMGVGGISSCVVCERQF